jgi:hypothetical protein
MPVSFLSPWFLFAGLFAVLPVIIHLLQRRREVVLPYSMVRFILLAKKRSSRRLRLKRLFLLLLRMAAIILLAVILSRPIVPSPAALEPSGGTGNTVVILDNSLSMAAGDSGRSRFDIQLDLTRQMSAGVDVGERLALLTAAARDRTAPLPLWVGPREFADALEGVEVQSSVADFVAALGKAYILLRDVPGGVRRILVYTDLARGGWEDFTLLSVEEADPTVPVTVYRVGKEGDDGAGILGVTLGGETRVAGDPREVGARIVNWGPRETLVVEMWHDGRLVDRKVAKIQPGEEGKILFGLKASQEGVFRGEFRLEKDRYREDDRRSFGFSLSPPVRVLLVDGDPRLSLVEGETFFLREALRPRRLSLTDPIEVEVVSPEEFGLTSLEDRDVVMMANVPAPADRGKLEGFVGEGGGLVLFWGGNCDPDEYRRTLSSLLPVQPSGIADAPEGSPFRVGEMMYEHDILSLFSPPEGGTFATASFLRRLEVPEETPGAEVLARFTDGAPWIVEGAAGRGRVLLFTSTADLAWNDLSTKPVFVPLIRRVVLDLTSNLLAGTQEDIAAGEEVVFEASPKFAFTFMSVKDPNGDVTRLEYLPAGDTVRAVFRESWSPGFYEYSGQGEEGVFAVNVPPQESDLRPLAVEDVLSRFQKVPLSIFSVGEGAASQELAQAGVHRLTRAFFIGLFFLLILEMLVAGPRPSFSRRSS